MIVKHHYFRSLIPWDFVEYLINVCVHKMALQVAALGAICNIAVNLTPRKSILLQSGAVSQLVHLSKSMDPTLRLKAVWALRNIMFLLNPKDKDFILKELTLSTLSSLICGKSKRAAMILGHCWISHTTNCNISCRFWTFCPGTNFGTGAQSCWWICELC